MIDKVFLGILVVGTFLLRVIPQWDKVFVDGQVWFRGVDSWYHMRLVDNMMANLPIPLKWDMFATYPGGLQVGYFPVLSWLVAIPGRVFDYEIVGAFLPPILGALTLIPVYYIGKMLFSKEVGLFACLLIAILPGEFFHRSLLGFTDHHALEVFFATLTILFLILANKNIEEEQIKLRYLILAGISLGFYLSTWLGGLLLMFPLWLWFAVTFTYKLIMGKPTIALCKITSITFIIAFVMFLPHLFLMYSIETLLLLVLGATLTPYAFQFLSKSLGDWKWFVTITGTVLLTFIILCYLFFPVVFNYPRAAFMGFGATIGEALPTTPFVAFSCYGISILLFFGGLYYAIKNKQNSLFLIYTLLILLLTIGQRRWGYYFTINCALLASYFIFLIGAWAKPNLRVAVMVVMCFFTILPSVRGTIGIADLPNNITNDWYKACVWLKENTPSAFPTENAYYGIYPAGQAEYGILSWWDYGHWIIRIGHRVPITSPTYQDVPVQGKTLVAQSEGSANASLEGLNIKYIIVDEDMVVGKFHAIVQKSQLLGETDKLRLGSFATKLWSEKTETWKKIHQEGKVKIFERIH